MTERQQKATRSTSSIHTKHVPRAKLNEMQVVRIAASTLLSVDTVRRWAKGDPTVRPSTNERISRAALKVGIPMQGAA